MAQTKDRVSTREKLVLAAAAEFREHGFAGTDSNRIARRAGQGCLDGPFGIDDRRGRCFTDGLRRDGHCHHRHQPELTCHCDPP